MDAVYYAACALAGLGALAVVLNALDAHNKAVRGGSTPMFMLRIAVAASIAVCVWRALP